MNQPDLEQQHSELQRQYDAAVQEEEAARRHFEECAASSSEAWIECKKLGARRTAIADQLNALWEKVRKTR